MITGIILIVAILGACLPQPEAPTEDHGPGYGTGTEPEIIIMDSYEDHTRQLLIVEMSKTPNSGD